MAHSDATQDIADDINLSTSFVTPVVNGSRVVHEDDLMKELGITTQELGMWVDVEALMNPCPLTVQAACPLPKV